MAEKINVFFSFVTALKALQKIHLCLFSGVCLFLCEIFDFGLFYNLIMYGHDHHKFLPPGHANTTRYVAIEGNIGAGKTSLCNNISKIHHNYFIIEEEINGILNLFYKNPKKYAFTLQWGMLKSRIYQFNLFQLKRKFDPDLIYLNDRSVLGDYVFAIHNYHLGNLSNKELDVYEETLHGNLDNLSLIPYVTEPDIFVYLNTDPNICKHRVENIRKNNYENDIDLAYYVGIDDVYFHLFTQVIFKNINRVIIINNNLTNKEVDNVELFHRKINYSLSPGQLIYKTSGECTDKVKETAFMMDTPEIVYEAYESIKKMDDIKALGDHETVAIPWNMMTRDPHDHIYMKHWKRYEMKFYENDYKRVFLWLLSKNIKIYWYNLSNVSE